MRQLMHHLFLTLLALSSLFAFTATAQPEATLDELNELVQNACPSRWQRPMSSIYYDGAGDLWSNDMGDKGHFVHYASDYLQGLDGNLSATSYSDAPTVIYECGGLKTEFYIRAKEAAEVLINAIDGPSSDADQDGVLDGVDICPGTVVIVGDPIDLQGCSESQRDADSDGVDDTVDMCTDTEPGDIVDSEGCALRLQDSDNDGVNDLLDQCPDTIAGDVPNAQGCAPEQIDTDSDGTPDYRDAYPRQNRFQCTP